MPSPECDSDTLRIADAADAQPRTVSGMRAGAGPEPQPKRSGSRLVSPGQPNVHVVDPAGYRRRIANHSTYDRLFRDWRGIVDAPDLESVAERPPLTSGSLLVRGDASARIYLLDEGRKRLIPSDAVMDKYWFNWGRICVVRQILIDHVPTGDVWD
jgi:hypothetical protein